ncbi:hypothetical protein [Deinococcus sp. DB0503]|uniref:hypothetical protein n=1 Tax=Deinococcus sp. DB0503 TaxID=2479203 RepID=UPI0018E0434B|nr:hypothetical protein [Deinococcus sp. DB0503]MBI0447138.1 hypothetical protein [Deinococcus sp. DB0503]
MELLNLIATVAALAGLLLTLVQLLKAQAGLKGRRVLLVSALLGMALGAVFAAGGLIGFNYLPAWPPPVGGSILGLLAGLVASGGKDTITGIQINGAKARARAEAEYSCPPQAAPQPPGTPSPADEWEDASLDDLTR